MSSFHTRWASRKGPGCVLINDALMAKRSSPASPSASSQAFEAQSQKPFWVTHVRLNQQASLGLELLQTSRATVGHFRVSFPQETLEGLSRPWPLQIYCAAPRPRTRAATEGRMPRKE